MKAFRLAIFRHGQLLGQFDSSTAWAEDAVRDLMQRLPAQDGYRTELYVANDEYRVLESGPDGIKVLGRTPLFRPMPISALTNAAESGKP